MARPIHGAGGKRVNLYVAEFVDRCVITIITDYARRYEGRYSFQRSVLGMEWVPPVRGEGVLVGWVPQPSDPTLMARSGLA